MLQLATPSARGASETPDLLIIRAVEQHLALSSTSQKLFRTGLAVTVEFAISTIGNSAGPIGAGYMIINELAPTRAGCGANCIPAGLADLIHRALGARPLRGSSSLFETRGT